VGLPPGGRAGPLRQAARPADVPTCRPSADDGKLRRARPTRLRPAVAARPALVVAQRAAPGGPAPGARATAGALANLPPRGLVPLAAPARRVPVVRHLHAAWPGPRLLGLGRQPALLLGLPDARL